MLYRPVGTVAFYGNANRYDPTNTGLIRRRFEAEISRKMRALAKAVRAFVGTGDELGLAELKTNAGFRYKSSSERINAFRSWLDRQQKKGLLEVKKGPDWSGDKAWSDLYIESAYKKGLQSSANNLKAAGADVADSWVQDGFFRPLHADAAGLIYTRTFNELKGISDQMASRMSGILAQGMIDGKGPMAIAREMTENIKGISRARARTIARSEVISAYNESSLNAYEEAGVMEVDVLVEFATAGDNKVCQKCQELEGQTFSLEKSRGMIPVHPNCRCAWIPKLGSDFRGVVLK